MSVVDTIVAGATPPGRGGIGVIRLSGPAALAIARAVTGRELKPRTATYSRFRDRHGQVVDEGIALAFTKPASFTGEDVVELQGHGGPVVMDLLLGACLAQGARMARPGEFSERAFLNDKMDLAQAEAVADLIDSQTETAARSALRSLQGDFSQRVDAVLEGLTNLRIHVEAAMDFPEEEIDFLADDVIASQLQGVAAALATLLGAARQGALLREGGKLVLVGRPNAGKSSLMNRLTGRDSAIVTAIAGTTRDVIQDTIDLGGVPVRISDTAGLRDASDEIEAEGVRRARAELASADRVLLVIDAQANRGGIDAAVESLREELQDLVPTDRHLVVLNKADLYPDAAHELGEGAVPVSATTGLGVEELTAALADSFRGDESEATFTARTRHVHALERAGVALADAGERLIEGEGELMAEDLRAAQQALGEITGQVTSDDLLGKIFASFCIGK